MAFNPLCVVSDGVSLYTAFFGYPDADASPMKRPGPDLVLARSSPYPSFGNTTWTVVSKVENFNRNLTNLYHNHLCAWNPHSSSIAISARPPGHPTFEARYNLELSAAGQIISLHNATDSKDAYGNENGRSVLLHIDPGRGDPNHPWIQIRVDILTNQLVFTYFGKGMTAAGEPQGRWDMDVTKTGRNLLLTHTNDTLYVLGARSTDPPTYIMSLMPLDTTTTPPIRPSVINTIDTNIPGDCDLSNQQTTMHPDKGIVYILCTRASKEELTLKLYGFDGKDTEYLGQVSMESMRKGIYDFYEWAPTPNNGSASTWAYFLGREKAAWRLKYSNSISTSLAEREFLVTNPGYRTMRESIQHSDGGKDDNSGSEVINPRPSTVPFMQIIVMSLSAIVALTLLAHLIYRYSRRVHKDAPPTATAPSVHHQVHNEIHHEDMSDLPEYEAQDTTEQMPPWIHDTASEPPSYSIAVPTGPTSASADSMATHIVDAEQILEYSNLFNNPVLKSMHAGYPFCIVSDGISLYTVFFGHKADRMIEYQPDLLIARSNPYPSFSNVTWTVVASLKEFKRDPHQDQNYLCAWDPGYSAVVIFARSRVFQNDDVGYNLRMPVNGQDAKAVDWVYSEQVYDEENGRSVLLRVGLNNKWIQIRSDKQANRLEFTYFGSEMFPADEAESRWDMDVARTGSNLILTHSNNTLYALGLKNANTRTYAISEIPLDTTKIPLTQPSTIKTTDTIIERGCDLTNSQTSMHTDNGTVYIVCYSSRETEQSVNLYRFNGISMEHLGQVPGQLDATGKPGLYQWIPVPKTKSASTWAYFLGHKRQAKLLKYPDANSSYAIAEDTFETGYLTLREIDVYPRNRLGNGDYS
ncbi:hypothetical protein BGX34_002883, partial [Mortierella sp. NVP85]